MPFFDEINVLASETSRIIRKEYVKLDQQMKSDKNEIDE